MSGSFRPWSSRKFSIISGVASIGRNRAAGSPVSRDRKKTMTRSRTSDTKLDRIREAYLGMTFLRFFLVGGRGAGGAAPRSAPYLKAMSASSSWELVAIVGVKAILSPIRAKLTMWKSSTSGTTSSWR